MASPLHGFRRERLPQDHMVSYRVCVLAEGERLRGLQDHQVPQTTAHCVPWPPSSGAHIPVTSPGCCCCSGPPESGLWAQRWCRRWQPQSGAPARGARGSEQGQEARMGLSALSPEPRASQLPVSLGEGAPDQALPTPLALTWSRSRKRRKAGTESSSCSKPRPPRTASRGGSKTWPRAWGLVSKPSSPTHGRPLPTAPPPPPPHLAEDVQDAIGGEEVSHIHAGVLHPDPLEGSGQSSATGGLKWTLKGVWRLPGTRAPTGGPQPGPDTLIQDLQDGTRASPGPM